LLGQQTETMAVAPLASSEYYKLCAKPQTIVCGRKSYWITRKEYTRVRSLGDMDHSDPTRVLTEKLQDYMMEVGQTPPSTWFHRKSYRLVLSMLQIKNPRTEAFEFIRGINSEISLPTGSVCAERAAITAARSRFPDIKREHFYAIAVIDFPLFDQENQPLRTVLNPLGPCGGCREYLQKFHEKNENFRVVTYSGIDCIEVHERFLFISKVTKEISPNGVEEFWKCLLCSTMNEPRKKKCQHCWNFRFTANTLGSFAKSILKILDTTESSLTVKEICAIGRYKCPMTLIGNKLKVLIMNDLVEAIAASEVEIEERAFQLTSLGSDVIREIARIDVTKEIARMIIVEEKDHSNPNPSVIEFQGRRDNNASNKQLLDNERKELTWEAKISSLENRPLHETKNESKQLGLF